MADSDDWHPMPLFDSRDAYVDHLENEASGADPATPRPRKNLVKSYVLETVREHRDAPNAADTFATAAGLRAVPLDRGDLYRLHNGDGEVVALMEATDTRFPVLHSTIDINPLDSMVSKAVATSPWLDNVWLSGRFFDALWRWTKQTADPNRLVTLKFLYVARYEQLDGQDIELGDEEELEVNDDGDEPVRETRRSRFEVSDRVGVLDARLARLRDIYDPLQSTVRIKIPSGVSGNHEVFGNGKITNRSVSFAEQQKIVRLLVDLYRRVTEEAEDKLWYSSSVTPPGETPALSGRPVLMQFPERLDLSTLHTWANRTFGNRRNSFRLGGHPMWSGPDRTRLHVYGIDRHLWQPMSLEATRDHILVVLPVGTCGNTINRLVTNVQQFLSPSVQTWIGEFPYDEMLEPEQPVAV